jgi:hypothetical protein
MLMALRVRNAEHPTQTNACALAAVAARAELVAACRGPRGLEPARAQAAASRQASRTSGRPVVMFGLETALSRRHQAASEPEVVVARPN